jgi:4-amino-4-deoxy-L-arabinose transferase-like glycosyltransferase
VTESQITRYWAINSEHPPLDKVWTGIFWKITRGITDDLTAHRLGNMLLASILVALLYFWISESYSWIAGLAASAALLTMPRFFFHAHLSALDVPASFSVFAATFAFWKLKDRKGWGWGILLGVIWGLGLATKVNAAFVPVTLVLWWLLFSRRWTLFFRLVLMGIIAIPVFFAVWPWLYVNTLNHLGTYIAFLTVNHWEIGQYYLGHFFMPPPWHFGFVMLWAVIPLGITILYLIGFLSHLKPKKDSGLTWLLFLSALTPVLAIALTGSLVYDNDRMYMATFPFLAGLAGIGLGWLSQKLKAFSANLDRKYIYSFGSVLLAGIFFIPQLVSMATLYPHYLSYYGEGVGGVTGARNLGLETTYWCESYALALPIINAQAQPGDVIWADPWSHDVLIYYQTQGKLRSDLRVFAPEDVPSILGPDVPRGVVIPMAQADWFIFEHRQTTFGPWLEQSQIARLIKGQEVVYEYAYRNVPIMTLLKAH